MTNNKKFDSITACTGVWSCSVTTGDRPPPCSHFTFTAIDDRRAVVFGGFNGESKINTVYIIDLITMVIIHQCPCNSTEQTSYLFPPDLE